MAAAPLAANEPVSKKALPNVIVILADDLGYGDVGCYNPESKIATPNLDRMAKAGMRFTDAHSPCTVCTPTRYSLMTGRMAFRVPNGGRVFAGAGGPSLIQPNELTLPGLLREQGYSTACVGKWHVGLTFYADDGKPIHESGLEAVKRIDYSREIDGGPIDCGVDYFYGTACCPTTDWLYAYVDGKKIPNPPVKRLDRTTLPKHPYANDNRRGMKADDFDLEEVDLQFLKKSQQFLKNHVEKKPETPFFLFHSTQAVHLPSFPGNQFKGKTESGPHGDFIFELDYVVGELMKTLEDLNIDDNTLVIFTSDNGPEVPTVHYMRKDHQHDGARPWRGVKRDNWEGGHRVPMIVRWPGKVPAGKVSSQLTSLTDVMATIAEVVGAEIPDDAAADSFSMLPAFLGTAGDDPIRPYILQQGFGGSRYLAIRRDNWKYLAHKGSGGNNYDKHKLLKQYQLPELEPDAPGQLYNLQSDPGETTNLSSKHPGIVKELSTLLQKSIADGRSVPTRESAVLHVKDNRTWVIDTQQQWKENSSDLSEVEITEGKASPTAKDASFKSTLKRFDAKRSAASILIEQSPEWLNWNPIKNLGPTNLGDAPVMLSLGPDNYWMFGRYNKRRGKGKKKPKPFNSKPATLDGFDIPLQTTPFPNQFDAAGASQKKLGGYHAWQSKDMVNWVHHGAITESKARWMTTAEFADGKAYFYYDFPNDQDPHVYVDDDLFDGVPGEDKGMAYDDPSHGSDCAIIRGLDGKFHLIVEDWSPINARNHSWDSPLAAHAVSPDGLQDFKLMEPPVDNRTKPTGEVKTYKHPHWVKEHPERFKTNVAEFNVHEPEQEAYGDWAAISIGGQYYLFGDYDPVESEEMSVGWFTSDDINKPFKWCGNIGKGHPDPDVMFAEGKFYLATQQQQDFVSSGPWVEEVSVRVGVDVDNDETIDQWTDWTTVKESYDYVEGFAKQVAKTAAQVDLATLPAGFGFQFEVKIRDTTENASRPIIDKVELSFSEAE